MNDKPQELSPREKAKILEAAARELAWAGELARAGDPSSDIIAEMALESARGHKPTPPPPPDYASFTFQQMLDLRKSSPAEYAVATAARKAAAIAAGGRR